jgi:hypothetical protein
MKKIEKWFLRINKNIEKQATDILRNKNNDIKKEENK